MTIDEQWLQSLDFEGVSGYRIQGCMGIGSEKVAFLAIAPDGAKRVLKTYLHHLGYHIREIPMIISERPLYDLERVNRKLLALLDIAHLDEMTSEYDRMYSMIVSVLHGTFQTAQGDVAAWRMALPLIGMNVCKADPEAFDFLMSTAPLLRRLEEIAALPCPEPPDPASAIVQINGPNFPITGPRKRLIAWAREVLSVIPMTAQLDPSSLTRNPLYVWGAAAMDGFFTDDQLPAVASFVKRHFGDLAASRNASTLLLQMSMIVDMLGALKHARTDRLVRLCAALDFILDPSVLG
jgi:hypothetical protein